MKARCILVTHLSPTKLVRNIRKIIRKYITVPPSRSYIEDGVKKRNKSSVKERELVFLLFYTIGRKLFFHELLHLGRVSGVDRPIWIIYAAVIEHQLYVFHKDVQV